MAWTEEARRAAAEARRRKAKGAKPAAKRTAGALSKSEQAKPPAGIRARQWVEYTDPVTGAQRQGRYMGPAINPKDRGMLLINSGKGGYQAIAPNKIKPSSPQAKAKRASISAMVQRGARTDLSVMANPNLKIHMPKPRKKR